MRSYIYRITDYDIILITEDNDFGNSFLDYFKDIYGIRNERGFARILIVRNCDDALELISAYRFCAVIIDDDVPECNVDILSTQIQEKKVQQFLYYTDSEELKEIEGHKHIFRAEIMFVLLEERVDTSIDIQFPKDTRVYHLGKPVTFEELSPLICPTNVMYGSHADSLKDPITRLPSGELIGRKIKEIANTPDQTLVFIEIVGFEQLKKTYTYDELAEIELFVADIVEQCVDEYQPSKGWIGSIGNHFFIAIAKDCLKPVKQKIMYLFEKGIRSVCLSDKDAKSLSLAFENNWQPPKKVA